MILSNDIKQAFDISNKFDISNTRVFTHDWTRFFFVGLPTQNNCHNDETTEVELDDTTQTETQTKTQKETKRIMDEQEELMLMGLKVSVEIVRSLREK